MRVSRRSFLVSSAVAAASLGIIGNPLAQAGIVTTDCRMATISIANYHVREGRWDIVNASMELIEKEYGLNDYQTKKYSKMFKQVKRTMSYVVKRSFDISNKVFSHRLTIKDNKFCYDLCDCNGKDVLYGCFCKLGE